MYFKSKISLIVDVLRSSFISLVPFYILYSFVLLFVELVVQFSLSFPIEKENLYDLSKLLNALLPVLVNISISYHLATLYYTNISRLLAIVLSLIIYFSVNVLDSSVHIDSYTFPESMIFAILIPIFSCFFLSKVIFKSKYQDSLRRSLSKNIAMTVIYIVPFIFIYFMMTSAFFLICNTLEYTESFKLFDEGLESVLLFIRTLFSSLLWFLGIHGVNFFDALVDVSILNNTLLDNLTYKEFFNHFVVLGGSGAGLSLVLAIFIASKDKHISFVGRISLPFVLFNINEILIFGIPIFMNFSLLIPFVLVPLVNLFLSFIFLSYFDMIVFTELYIPWTTPALVNMYMATDGNLIAVFFQLFLVLVGTLIYIPFIRRYSKIQSSTLLLERLSNKLDISTDIDSKADIKFHEAQSNIIKSHHKVNRVIELINRNNLLLHYQPKVDIQNKTCKDFEALLRIKDENGKIKGPDFIIDIENSGLASIIDIWVCKEVKKDLDSRSNKSFSPRISINIFPYTLEDRAYVDEIINILKGYDICFEIIERGSALNQNVLENINLLKKNGFKISLDDLGVGFTNFSILYELPLDSVKIDKKIIEFTKEERGFNLYQNICNLCKDLDLKIILEGVETKEEFEKLKSEDIYLVQGWYFSKAIAFEEIESYSKNFKV